MMKIRFPCEVRPTLVGRPSYAYRFGYGPRRQRQPGKGSLVQEDTIAICAAVVLAGVTGLYRLTDSLLLDGGEADVTSAINCRRVASPICE